MLRLDVHVADLITPFGEMRSTREPLEERRRAPGRTRIRRDRQALRRVKHDAHIAARLGPRPLVIAIDRQCPVRVGNSVANVDSRATSYVHFSERCFLEREDRSRLNRSIGNESNRAA